MENLITFYTNPLIAGLFCALVVPVVNTVASIHYETYTCK